MPAPRWGRTWQTVGSDRRNGRRSETSVEGLPARRPLIVFLHGTRLSGAQWASQVAELGDEFDCLVPDLPGHGRLAAETFTLSRAAEEVARTIERDDARRQAVLVGLSLGGYVAMEVASRWPERVAGLVLAGATAEPVGPRSLPYRGLAWLLARLNSWFFRWRYAPSIAEPIVAAGFAFPGGATAVRALIGERFIPRLARYPGPALILNGEYDLLFRLSERSFAAAAADVRRVLIRRATHLTNLDQPAAFTAAVRRFARELAAAADVPPSGDRPAG
jgi:pimeloyl-ACP methyl ester carboxylesterase